MSVNSKMTAIANATRALDGSTGKLTLDGIASKLGVEKTNIAAAFTAIAEKGVTVPDGSTSAALAELIASIEAGGGNESFMQTGTYSPAFDETFGSAGIWEHMSSAIGSNVTMNSSGLYIALHYDKTYSKTEKALLGYCVPNTGNTSYFLLYRSSSGQTGKYSYSGDLSAALYSNYIFVAGATYHWAIDEGD